MFFILKVYNLSHRIWKGSLDCFNLKHDLYDEDYRLLPILASELNMQRQNGNESGSGWKDWNFNGANIRRKNLSDGGNNRTNCQLFLRRRGKDVRKSRTITVRTLQYFLKKGRYTNFVPLHRQQHATCNMQHATSATKLLMTVMLLYWMCGLWRMGK